MLSPNLTTFCTDSNPETPAPEVQPSAPASIAPNILAIRRAHLIKIQGELLASGMVPRSCRDLGRISPEAILHAAWIIQCRQQVEEVS